MAPESDDSNAIQNEHAATDLTEHEASSQADGHAEAGEGATTKQKPEGDDEATSEHEAESAR